MVTLLSNLQIYTETGICKNGSVLIEDGRIAGIYASDNFPKDCHVIEFPNDCYLVPGFIDLHIHGANGGDTMDASFEALHTMCQALAKEGTTGFLATTMSADVSDISQVLAVTNDFMRKQHSSLTFNKGARILGVHLEGPFISPQKVGAQRSDKILNPQIELIQTWQNLNDQIIKLVTLAPELPGSVALIEFLKQNQIIASVGHTNATFAETMSAIKAGCSYATHLFNAMRGMHQREPGAVTAALLSDQVMAELILDGQHLHPAIVQLAVKLKSKNNLVLVTDAMRAKCLNDGIYDLGGQAVTLKNNTAQLADGTIAGSVLKMNSALKNLLSFTDCTLADAVQMTSENPARQLGIFNKKGSIALQKDADLVVMDAQFNILLTICQGEIVFQK